MRKMAARRSRYEHRRIGVLCGIALSAALVFGCSSPAPPSGRPSDPPPYVSGYRLNAGERLQVTVAGHEDLSGEFSIDEHGYLALPTIEILAAGLTVMQLEIEIERMTGYSNPMVPTVRVDVLAYRPFYIIGEVRNPGSFQYVSGMTVINAVALAGGFTYRADQDDIIISRGGGDGPKEQARPDSQVLPGDIVEVTERFF